MTPVDPARDPLLGRTIAGKFTVEQYLGGGAMGAVYRARHVQLETIVALKILHRQLSTDATFLERFQKEARAAFRIDHPNSMRVIDYGEEQDGLLYIAMEYLDGKDLYEILKRDHPLPPDRIADIMRQTLGALATAHDLGIVHRDIKPENIMILERVDDEGRPRDFVKVCDFGIAKMMEETKEVGSEGPRTTGRGMIIGTPEYMSPEQGRGEPLDARSDLYSVGIILYQLLTRRVPFDAESPLATVVKHMTDAPTPPRALDASVDPHLEAICLRALAKRREDRFASAREMRVELGGVSSRGSLAEVGEAEAPGGGTLREPFREEDARKDTVATPVLLPDIAPDVRARLRIDTMRVPAKPRATGWLVGGALLAVTGVAVYSYAKIRASGPGPVASASAPPALSASVGPALGSLPTSLPVDPKTLSSGAPVLVPSVAPPVLASATLPTNVAPHPSSRASATSQQPSSRPSTSTNPPHDPIPVASANVTPVGSADPGPYSGNHATVELGNVVGAPWKETRKVIPLALFTQCFREDLRGIDKPPTPFNVSFSLKTDASGAVTSFAFNGAFAGTKPQELSSCVSNNMTTGGKIAGVGAPSVISGELVFRP